MVVTNEEPMENGWKEKLLCSLFCWFCRKEGQNGRNFKEGGNGVSEEMVKVDCNLTENQWEEKKRKRAI